MEIVQQMYECFCNAMGNAFENLLNKFNNLSNCCLSEEQKFDHSNLLKANPLIFPGDDDEDDMFLCNPETPKNQMIDSKKVKASENEDDSKIEEEEKNPLAMIENKEDNFDTEEYSTRNNIIIPSFKRKMKSNIRTDKNKRKYTFKCNSNDQRKIAATFAINISLVGGQILELWHRYIELNKTEPKMICEFLKLSYEEISLKKWTQNIVTEIYKVENYVQTIPANMTENHLQTSAENKKKGINFKINMLKIEDVSLIKQSPTLPILFEDVYLKSFTKKTENVNETYLNIFILVHGFQGNSLDMCLFKNNISLLHPDSLVLSSTINEAKTEGDIIEMGKRLADEIIGYINEFCPGEVTKKISFIGHSLGGVIIRSALPYLAKYKDSMASFISFSVPHLGYIYNGSSIIGAGIWVLKKWKKSKALQQITMSESNDLEKSFIYELSLKEGLEWFKNIILVGSSQDGYVPLESSLIELNSRTLSNKYKNNILVNMINNINQRIQASQIHRIDTIFSISEKSIDSFIGRTAHIQFLENENLLKMLLYKYKDYFD